MVRAWCAHGLRLVFSGSPGHPRKFYVPTKAAGEFLFLWAPLSPPKLLTLSHVGGPPCPHHCCRHSCIFVGPPVPTGAGPRALHLEWITVAFGSGESPLSTITVGHLMLVYKLRGNFSLLCFVFIKLFLIMVSGTRCLYASSRAMFADSSLCS